MSGSGETTTTTTMPRPSQGSFYAHCPSSKAKGGGPINIVAKMQEGTRSKMDVKGCRSRNIPDNMSQFVAGMFSSIFNLNCERRYHIG